MARRSTRKRETTRPGETRWISSGPTGPVCFLLPFQLSHCSPQHSALLNTGAVENLITAQMISELQMTLESLHHPVPVASIDGHLLQPYPIQNRTAKIRMWVGDHPELIHFLVITSSSMPLILGYPLFRTYNPDISWPTQQILAWGPDCSKRWFQ